MSRFFWLLAAVFCLLFTAAASGTEGPAPTLAPEPSSASDIVSLLGDLDDPTYVKRQAATRRLAEIGPEAIFQLEAAAGAGSREVSSRAFEILKRHYQSGDETSRLAAREALDRLAARSDVSAAQRARDILNPPKPVVATNRLGPPAAIPAPANNVRAIFPAGGAGLRRVSVSDINGRKSIEIDDRERTIKMDVAPGGQITAQITDKQNANAVRKVDANDLADLRQKDAELARLFEQYAGLPQRGGGPPAPARPWGVPPPPIAKGADGLRAQLQSLEVILNRYRERAPTDISARRMVEALEQTKARLQALDRPAARPDLAR